MKPDFVYTAIKLGDIVAVYYKDNNDYLWTVLVNVKEMTWYFTAGYIDWITRYIRDLNHLLNNTTYRKVSYYAWPIHLTKRQYNDLVAFAQYMADYD